MVLALDHSRRAWRWFIAASVLGVVASALVAVSGAASGSIAQAVRNVAVILAEMTPPDFSRAGAWAAPIRDTLAMAVAGTGLAVLVAVPLGLAGSTASGMPRLLSRAVKLALAGLRSVPDIALGLILVVAVGQGALSGTLALALYSVGMLGKFTAEAMDHVDADLLELGRALRLPPLLCTLRIGVPQILPRLMDYTLYRLEHNVRASAVLGLVGAGGIGFELISAFRIFAYDEAAAILIVIVVMVALTETAGHRLRAAMK